MRRDLAMLKKQLNINKKQEVVLCKMRDQVDQIESLIEKRSLRNRQYIRSRLVFKKKYKLKDFKFKIEKYYNLAIKNGSLGGKLCGAGEGIFTDFYSKK